MPRPSMTVRNWPILSSRDSRLRQLREIGEGDALRPPIGAGGRRVGRFPFGQSGCRQSGPQVV